MPRVANSRLPPEPDQARFERAYKNLRADPKSAGGELRALAELNSVKSMNALGQAYHLGIGVQPDFVEAERWFQKAASLESYRAQYFLGRLYLGKKEYQEAKTAFEEAANRGYAPAIHHLGRMYYFGQGVDRDLGYSQQLMERAAEAGSITAKSELAIALMQGSFGRRQVFRGLLLWLSGLVEAFQVALETGLGSDRFQ
jgi:TPR repeat protein